MSENLFNLMKTINLQIQEFQQIPRKLSKYQNKTPRHNHNQTVKKIKRNI